LAVEIHGNVLTVHDDPDVLDVVCPALASKGHVVERTIGGLAALDILGRKRIDPSINWGCCDPR
jgi:CheY-like chemotaxis protein